MPSQIALLGAVGSGRHALVRELAPRLACTSFALQVIEDIASLQAPALVLLLAAQDAAGEVEELRWREALARAGIGFSVLHGDAKSRMDVAWRLIQPLLDQAPTQHDLPAGSTARWNWSCEKCSDPACEHRLFQDLLQGRRAEG